MKKRKVSLIIFFNDKKEILLQSRNGINKKKLFDWGFFGGAIEENETPEKAIEREVIEELSFVLKKYTFIGSIRKIIDYDNDKLDLEAFLYKSNCNNINDFIQKEGDKMKFFSIEDAKKLDMNKNFDNFILEIIEDNL